MKVLSVGLGLAALAAAATAQIPSNEYLPPTEDLSLATSGLEAFPEAEPAAIFGDDGYRYKTVRRLRHRHRRQVGELPSNEYLPPVAGDLSADLPSSEYLAPIDQGLSSGFLADDGYRYKTVRRLRHRHRRQVGELPSNEYLPPVAGDLSADLPSSEYLAPIDQGLSSGFLADDGYRYKTVRRLRHRHRRQVGELPSNEYLPPVAGDLSADLPSSEYLAPFDQGLSSGFLADDGYRYKTVRRLRHRHRRQVGELPSNEYLPPVAGDLSADLPSSEYLAPIDQGLSSGFLADDGYRYKTVRRLRHRHRRQVGELPSNEYLPPVAGDLSADLPSSEYLAPIDQGLSSGFLADDGYRYKTVRRLRHRRRRDVNELASNEYLPPVEGDLSAGSLEYLPPVQEAAPAAVLAEDGYRYKTVKKYKIRRH